MEGVVIREAKIEDCEAIMDNIKENAVHQNFPEGVKIDAEVLRQNGFGEERLFRCLIAERDCSGKKEVIGQALYFVTFSAWEGRTLFLDDIYVKPDFRGKGVGTALWRNVAKVCLDIRCIRMDWLCLEWNTSAIDFYKRKGAVDLTVKDKWHLFRLTLKELKSFVKEEQQKA